MRKKYSKITAKRMLATFVALPTNADADGSGSVTPEDIPAIVNIIMGK